MNNERAAKALTSRYLDDSILAERIASGAIEIPKAGLCMPNVDDLYTAPAEEFLCWREGEWWQWTGKVWEAAKEADAIEIVRLALKEQFTYTTSQDGVSAVTVKEAAKLLSKRKTSDVAYLLRGLLHKPASDFDTHADLLNVQNGVVDLRSGALRDHDPRYFMTKIAAVEYHPAAKHDDWTTALAAVPGDVRDWLQVRYGQAATGYPTDDDVLPIQTGGGQNGKSTMINAIASALGGYATPVPEQTLMAQPGAHPTELMKLRGARLAVIEETPEGKHLPTKRLKDLLGTPVMTARYMYGNFVSWDTTHSLFLNTNYAPQVSETDHGTWRRLALVKFPYKYVHPDEPLMAPNERHGDPGLRDRLRFNDDGQLEAVLAWVVAGAIRWYANNRAQLDMPLTVKADTQAWRAETDLILAYCQDRISFEPGSSVLSTELYDDFTAWLEASGRQRWNDQTFASRFGSHELAQQNHVEKRKARTATLVISRRFGSQFTTAIPNQAGVWLGIKFN